MRTSTRSPNSGTAAGSASRPSATRKSARPSAIEERTVRRSPIPSALAPGVVPVRDLLGGEAGAFVGPQRAGVGTLGDHLEHGLAERARPGDRSGEERAAEALAARPGRHGKEPDVGRVFLAWRSHGDVAAR